MLNELKQILDSSPTVPELKSLRSDLCSGVMSYNPGPRDTVRSKDRMAVVRQIVDKIKSLIRIRQGLEEMYQIERLKAKGNGGTNHTNI